ncbi:MAG: hypothetical protein V4714_01565 [Bacteroidota bacterium]
MRKSMTSKMSAGLLMLSMLAYTGCKEKETAVPTVDYARVDALRNELRSLQLQVLSSNVEKINAMEDNVQAKSDTASIKADIARLRKEIQREVTYTVYVTDLQGQFLKDAEISLTVDGAMVKKTTDIEGKAVFTKVRSGVVNGVVKLANYTATNYMASIAFSNSTSSVSTKVPLLPMAGTAGTFFTMKGTVYADMSDVDDNLNYIGSYSNTIEGKTIAIYNPAGPNANNPSTKYDVQAKKITAVPQVNAVPFTTGFGNSGDIQQIAYEGAVYTATSGADGSYTLQLPALVDGNGNPLSNVYQYQVNVEEFSAAKTLLVPGKSSNTNYDNNPYSLFANRAADGMTMLPSTTTDFVVLKTYTSNRNFRVATVTNSTMKIGEVNTQHFFYNDLSN